MIKNILFCLLVLDLFGCTKKNNINYKFEDHYKIDYFIKNNYLNIKIKLDKSVHAYGPGEKDAKPISLEILKDNGWEKDGDFILTAVNKSNLLSGDITIQQKIKPGITPGKAKLYLQVCTQTLCDRPRTHEINLSSP